MQIPNQVPHRHTMDDEDRHALGDSTVQRLWDSLERTIQAMIYIVEMRDPYTSGHQNRVTKLAVEIARELDIGDKRLRALKYAALLHDLGKVFIPAEILSKPGTLSDVEKSMVQLHPKYGYDVLRTIDLSWDVAEIVYQHHERLDGSGYPDHLTGDKLIPESRILAVADVAEAMVSHRPYRPALPLKKACEELERNADRLYDRTIAGTCIKVLNSGRLLLS